MDKYNATESTNTPDISFPPHVPSPSHYNQSNDLLSIILGKDILQHIFFFIPHHLRSAVMQTCSYWHNTIRKLKDFKSPSIKVQALRAARFGDLSYLHYLIENGYNIAPITFAQAALGGQLKVIKFLHKIVKKEEEGMCRFGPWLKKGEEWKRVRFKWDARTSWYAARGGFVDILKYTIENGWRNTGVCDEAAAYGNLECLKYAHKNGCAWSKTTSRKAAHGGHLECLKYLHENGCPCDFVVGSNAAENGHLDCLQYAYENGFLKGVAHEKFIEFIEFGTLECLKYFHEVIGMIPYKNCKSVMSGKLDMLKYEYENGCALDGHWGSACALAAINGHLDCLIYSHENGSKWDAVTCENAAKAGNLNCLKYAHENGCKWDERVFLSSNIDCIKYARENGCSWHEQTCEYAATDLECLKYVHENGAKWTEQTCTTIARKGLLECLKYAHENGCPWNEKTCSEAIWGGNLECLKYAHENGCKWDALVCENAASAGRLDFLKYAHENGCEWNEVVCRYAAQGAHFDILEYAHQNGCKWMPHFCATEAMKHFVDEAESESAWEYSLLHAEYYKLIFDDEKATRYLKCVEYIHEHGFKGKEKTCLLDIQSCYHKQKFKCLQKVEEKFDLDDLLNQVNLF